MVSKYNCALVYAYLLLCEGLLVILLKLHRPAELWFSPINGFIHKILQKIQNFIMQAKEAALIIIIVNQSLHTIIASKPNASWAI